MRPEPSEPIQPSPSSTVIHATLPRGLAWCLTPLAMPPKITRSMQNDYLEVHTPDGRRQVPIGDKPVTIGRHPENGIVITDPAASRRHCVVERTTSGFRVRDLNSS